MRKKLLEKRLAKLQMKIQELRAEALASNDAAEVRRLNAQIAEKNDEIDDINEELRMIEAAETEETREIPADARPVNFGGRENEHLETETREQAAGTSSVEYRRAFMSYVMKGAKIPADVATRAGVAISMEDVGAVVPQTVMTEFINTARGTYGTLYRKVRKTAYPAGMAIPAGNFNASFKWINESTVSPRQKIGKTAKISFVGNVAEIRIAQTFLSAVMTLDMFETEIARLIAEAYLEAMDKAIVGGSGDGMPLGLMAAFNLMTNEEFMGKTVLMTAEDMGDWTAWRKKLFATLPLKYRAGEFVFPMSTVSTYLETMADANNNPIFQQAAGLVVNDGDAQNPNGRFFGREITLVEPDIIQDFDTAGNGQVVGIFWQPENYVLNENYVFNMVRYFDQETNEYVNKAIVVCDGKPIDTNGFRYIVKAGAEG